MDKIRVLLAEDHAIMRDGIRAFLGRYDDIEIVGEVSDGKEAVAKTQELAPDVIVMDIAMPSVNGLEATRWIKKKKLKVQILVLTQYDDIEHISSAIKAGAAGYLPKSALGSELISAIRTVAKGESFLSPSAAGALIEDYRQLAKVEVHDLLTKREREILTLVAEGYKSREMAEMLHISLKTVLCHRMKILKKLHVHNSADLIKFAIRRGLVRLDT